MEKELELYIHIPFCIHKCNYCDFLSFAGESKVQLQYVQALLTEIEEIKIPDIYRVTSVFIGGGTPSVLPAEWITEILAKLSDKFVFFKDAEISLESNPGTLDEHKLSTYKRVGINRLSLGLQSADNDELKTLGRVHSYEEFLESYDLARAAGFHNINVDLMQALPNQSLDAWIRSLRMVASLEPEHISAYSLIIEEGTVFAKQQLTLPDEETERLMYEKTDAILSEYGYLQYEISNYAKPGFACRHNIGYWKRTEYLGLGLGSSSLMENTRYVNSSNMEYYLENCMHPEKLHREREVLAQKTQIEESIFLGLRLLEGVRYQEFEKNFGQTLDSLYGDLIRKLVEQGLLSCNEDSVKLTRKGISLSNYVFSQFLLD